MLQPESRPALPRYPQTIEVRVAYRVSAGILIRLKGLRYRWVYGNELTCGRVVITVDEVDQAGGVGVRAGVAERGAGSQPAGGFRVTPGVVGGGRGERSGGADNAAHGTKRVGHQVGDGSRGKVDLLGGSMARPVDIRAGGVHQQHRHVSGHRPHELLCCRRAAGGRRGRRSPDAVAVVAGGGHVRGGVGVGGELAGAVPGAGGEGGGALGGGQPFAAGGVGVRGGGAGLDRGGQLAGVVVAAGGAGGGGGEVGGGVEPVVQGGPGARGHGGDPGLGVVGVHRRGLRRRGRVGLVEYGSGRGVGVGEGLQRGGGVLQGDGRRGVGVVIGSGDRIAGRAQADRVRQAVRGAGDADRVVVEVGHAGEQARVVVGVAHGAGGRPGVRRQRVGDRGHLPVGVVPVPGDLARAVGGRGELAERVIHEAGGPGNVGHRRLVLVGVVPVAHRVRRAAGVRGRGGLVQRRVRPRGGDAVGVGAGQHVPGRVEGGHGGGAVRRRGCRRGRGGNQFGGRVIAVGRLERGLGRVGAR